MAHSKLRRFLAQNKTFNCADIKVGDSALFYKAPRRMRHPHWRGPALILGIDETGALVKFQTQSFKVARFCVRKQVKVTVMTQVIVPKIVRMTHAPIAWIAS